MQGFMTRGHRPMGYWIVTRLEWSRKGDCRLPTCSVYLQADVATVLRDGRLHVIPASELVPGDIVEIAGMPSQRMPHALQPLSAVRLALRRPCDSLCTTRVDDGRAFVMDTTHVWLLPQWDQRSRRTCGLLSCSATSSGQTRSIPCSSLALQRHTCLCSSLHSSQEGAA